MQGNRYLEIGCGFGFTLDYARRVLGLEVQGIDPSPYARAGATQLQLPINEGYLGEANLGGQVFDLVVASEVLEHVEDPREFLSAIAKRLAPAGVVYLTTPNAAFVTRSAPVGMLMPVLSPGWHYILFSAGHLERLLRECGFRCVQIRKDGHSIVAAATNGDAKINLEGGIDREAFVTYLEERRASVPSGGSLAYGFAYRQLKELTHTAQYGRAIKVYKELADNILRDYGFDIEIAHSEWLQSIEGESFQSFATRYPLILCGIGYFRGIIALNHDQAPATAAHFFSLAARFGQALRNVLREMAVDDGETQVLTDLSRVLMLRALSYTQPADAATGAKAIFAELGVNSTLQIEAELVNVFAHMVNLGALAEAEELAPDVLSLVERSGTNNRALPYANRQAAHRALGVLAMNRSGNYGNATRHFGIAERIAGQWLADEPLSEQAAGCIEEIREMLQQVRQREARGNEQGYFIMIRPWLFKDISAVETRGKPIFEVGHAEIMRVIWAYQRSAAEFHAQDHTVWKEIFMRQIAMHEAFMRGDVKAVQAALEDPYSNDLFEGFDDLRKDYMAVFSTSPATRQGYGHGCMDRLIALATALGSHRAYYPEQEAWANTVSDTPDKIVREIEEVIGQPIVFPEIFARCIGIPCKRGVISDRALHAIYLARKAIALAADKAPAILEIGAGAGRSAYYAMQFGARRYTIVDIPIAAACQGYYLMATMGADKVALAGEKNERAPVCIISPSEFFRKQTRFDVAVNSDSITELPVDVAGQYLREISSRVPVLLSINHEANEFSFREVCKAVLGKDPKARYPYWLRRGYVEEITEFPEAAER
jgi:SAM-dependent methyltransferase